jgi:hypothetical protein
MAAAIDIEIDAISADKDAMTPDDRRKEEARLTDEILHAERVDLRGTMRARPHLL